MSQGSFEASQSWRKVQRTLVRIWYLRSLSKISKRFQSTWSNRIIGHCETMLIHLTKVTKDFKNKYRSLKGKKTHKICYQKQYFRASLVAQWLRICLPMQGTRVRALVWEDPTCHGVAGPVSHNCWACTSGACALQWERPRWWEARAPRWRMAPACHN